MQVRPEMSEEELLTEGEAAARLNVSIPHLHRILDKYVFDARERRPAECTFRTADLVLLRFWVNVDPEPKVVAMPRRN